MRACSFPSVMLGLSASLLLGSCSLFDSTPDAPATPATPATPDSAAAAYDAYVAAGGSVDARTFNVNSPEDLARIDNGVEGEVFFTNPDDPDQEIAGITEAFENKRTGQRWIPNYVQGLRFSRRKGLSVIIWFHDSSISPKSKLVGRELLNTPQFLDWCKDRVICICLDAGSGMTDLQGDSKSNDNFRNIASIQRRYNLKKKPSFVVMSANGKIVKTIDGYDDYIGGLESDLKSSIEAADKIYAQYLKELSAKGFREWRSKDGQKTLFAKLTRFDDKNDMLYLKEHTGRQIKIHESEFHNSDVDYIENNIRKGGPKY